jgi:hypothetical protein
MYACGFYIRQQFTFCCYSAQVLYHLTFKGGQMEKGNIVYSCKEHGVETYFNIKKLEKHRKMRSYVYVWFKEEGHDEKMWVRITSGDRKKGQGRLDNMPTLLEHLKLGDHVRFKTDKGGITWGR